MCGPCDVLLIFKTYSLVTMRNVLETRLRLLCKHVISMFREKFGRPVISSSFDVVNNFNHLFTFSSYCVSLTINFSTSKVWEKKDCKSVAGWVNKFFGFVSNYVTMTRDSHVYCIFADEMCLNMNVLYLFYHVDGFLSVLNIN